MEIVSEQLGFAEQPLHLPNVFNLLVFKHFGGKFEVLVRKVYLPNEFLLFQ